MRDDAKSPLQTLGELICGCFHRCAIKAEGDIGFRSPCCALVIQEAHHLQSKLLPGRVRVGTALHPPCAFAQAGVTKRDSAVVIEEQLINDLSLVQPGESAVLPQDRSNIRWRSLQPLMSQHQGLFAQLGPFLHQFPEPVFISGCGTGNIDQVDRDNSLVKAAVVFMAAIRVQSFGIRSEE